MQILIDAVQELIESHEAAEGGGGRGNGDRGEGERKGGGGGGVERGGDGGCVSQLSFADAAPRSQHLKFSGMLPIPGTGTGYHIVRTVPVHIYFTVIWRFKNSVLCFNDEFLYI